MGYGSCVHGPYPISPAKPVTVATPDPAVCPTEGLRPHVRLGDRQSARWQGRETLPQRVRRRWESREVICVPFLTNDGKNRPYNADTGTIRNQEMVEGGAAMCLAFHRAISLSKGTKDCGRRAIETGIPTYLIDS